jgi:hypothetical protein
MAARFEASVSGRTNFPANHSRLLVENCMSLHTVFRRTGWIVLMLAFGATGMSLPGLAFDALPKAATPQVEKTTSGTNKAKSSRSRHRVAAHAHKTEAAKPAQAVEPPPVEPPPPNWPANAAAVPATVGWNGRQLHIAAENSSLSQILHDVSTATGVKVEGLAGDQRIFGSYGPADPRDVLAQLLDGSGYNVLMIGDQGAGIPRQVVLSAQPHASGKGTPSQAGENQPGPGGDDEEIEQPEQPEQQQPMPAPRPPFNGAPGVPNPQQGPGPGRTPQQLIQELQQRQQQQLEQQQQANPPQQPE